MIVAFRSAKGRAFVERKTTIPTVVPRAEEIDRLVGRGSRPARLAIRRERRARRPVLHIIPPVNHHRARNDNALLRNCRVLTISLCFI